jgi:hypothetical protein
MVEQLLLLQVQLPLLQAGRRLLLLPGQLPLQVWRQRRLREQQLLHLLPQALQLLWLYR